MLSAVRQHRSATLAAVLVALAAWLFVSNRCGLLLLSGTPAAIEEAHRCCETETPAQQAPAEQSTLCCKGASVALAEAGKFEPAQPVFVSVDWADFAGGVLVEVDPAEVSKSGGPPDGVPLVEMVFHSTLQAHGPPAVV